MPVRCPQKFTIWERTKKKNVFLNHKSYFRISWNFLELFHFSKITRKRSGLPKIREISYKVETLFMTYGCVSSWILFISVWIFILHQNPVFLIRRSNPTPDANQMRRTGYKKKFSILGTRRLAASNSLSAKRTLPSFRASWIFILHQKPSFFNPAVELDAGREPNAAHRIQKRILRPLHPPACGLDLPFGQTNAPQ